MEIENQEENKIEEVKEEPKASDAGIQESAPQETVAEIAEKIEEVSPETVEDVKAEEKPVEASVEKRWFVIQTYSGQEDRVKQAIEQNIDMLQMRSRISKVLVPEEDVVELHGKKRVEKKKKMFPGYVFLEMSLDEETWYTIRQTPGVARFIGTKVKPTPVSDREMQRVLKQIGIKEEKLEVAFEKGEIVRVISGPFRGHTGTVDEINPDREKIKVLINIFGRDTPVEVNFEHAEKVV
jgi:transcriptional antiterminator NusG